MTEIAIAHRLGVCYTDPQEVEVRVGQLKEMFGADYKIEIGSREQFRKRKFAYHTLDDVLDALCKDRVKNRKFLEERDAAEKQSVKEVKAAMEMTPEKGQSKIGEVV